MIILMAKILIKSKEQKIQELAKIKPRGDMWINFVNTIVDSKCPMDDTKFFHIRQNCNCSSWEFGTKRGKSCMVVWSPMNTFDFFKVDDSHYFKKDEFHSDQPIFIGLSHLLL